MSFCPASVARPALLQRRTAPLHQGYRRPAAATGAHSVHTPFVLLHLLKGQAERLAQLLLAHTEHHAPHAKPAADVLVDGIWILCAHLTPESAEYCPRLGVVFSGAGRAGASTTGAPPRPTPCPVQQFPRPNRTRQAEAGMTAPLGLLRACTH